MCSYSNVDCLAVPHQVMGWLHTLDVEANTTVLEILARRCGPRSVLAVAAHVCLAQSCPSRPSLDCSPQFMLPALSFCYVYLH